MFNTLKYAKILEEVGFTRTQAETSIRILVEIMEDKLASKQDLQVLGLAMKQDMKNLETSTKQEIQDLRTEMKNDFALIRSDMDHSLSKMTIRMGSISAASIVLFTGILTALHKFI